MDVLSIESLPAIKALFSTTMDPVYIVDRDYNLLWVNAAYRQMFGYRPRRQRLCHEVAKMPICQTDACLLRGCVELGRSTRYVETEVQGAAQPDMVCSAIGVPLKDASGSETLAVIGILRDVSAEVSLHNQYRGMLARERNQKEILAQMVADRTRELVTANSALQHTNSELTRSRQEIAEILQNIGQAILTIDSDFRIGQEYSHFSEALFGSTQLAGRNFPELLCENHPQQSERKELAEWLKLVFHTPTLNWSAAKSMVQREFRYAHPQGGVRELIVDFQPIREGGRLARLMIIAEDVSEKRALERSLEAKQREMDETIAHLAELARLDPELYAAFFEEALEILERSTQALSDLRTADNREKLISSMFRDMHTLKGNAMSFGLIRVAAKAHWVEDGFAVLRENAASLSETIIVETEEKVAELQQVLDRIQSMANQVLHQSTESAQTREQDRPAKLEIEVERIEALLRWVEQHALEVDTPLSKELLARVRALTLIPLSRLYQRLPKLVSELAQELGKEVAPLQLEGGGVAISPAVFNKLSNTLVHLLRNAVDHGIEAPRQRQSKGKASHATIAVRCSVNDAEVCLTVSDDGRGIDGPSLVRRAKDKGLLAQDKVLEGQAALNVIFIPGFSTAEHVTDVSGRGVGMDAVKATVEELKGAVEIQSTLEVGTTFLIRIPNQVALGEPST